MKLKFTCKFLVLKSITKITNKHFKNSKRLGVNCFYIILFSCAVELLNKKSQFKNVYSFVIFCSVQCGS